MSYFAAILLVINSALILAMLVVLVIVLRQGRRVAKLAEDSRDLANRASEAGHDSVHFDDLSDAEKERLLAEMQRLAHQAGVKPPADQPEA